MQINWNGIKGLQENIGHGGVCSNYSIDYVASTWQYIRTFTGGTAIFTQSETPIKCGGAPQKIAYLAEDHFRRSGIRGKCNVVFASAAAKIFAVEKYAKSLTEVIERKQIDAKFRTNLIEIRGEEKIAVFKNLDTSEISSINYDMIHVTPPMAAPDFIKNSPLADSNGWVAVDKQTLQHINYKNIFSLGDAAGLPTSKTGAAIRKQAPVVVANILSRLKNVEPSAFYDGYTSCPLVTGYDKLILAEFDYELKPRETFPFDQSKERRSMLLLKKIWPSTALLAWNVERNYLGLLAQQWF